MEYLSIVIGIIVLACIFVLVKVGKGLVYLSEVKARAELELVEAHPSLLGEDYISQLGVLDQQSPNQHPQDEDSSFVNLKNNGSQVQLAHISNAKNKESSLYNYIYDNQEPDQISNG
jgi:hypothetical protein